MEQKFFDLPEEKQLRIINAGFEVFSKYEYKKASTDEIAAIAGISKGLLFYYFHNKKEFYMYLYDYAFKLITEYVVNNEYSEITDFFELCEYVAIRKYSILVRNPHVLEFIVKGYYLKEEDVSKDLGQRVENISNNLLKDFFANVDFSKFRDDVNPQDIMLMLQYMTEGYMNEKQRAKLPLDMEDLMDKFKNWVKYLKRISYKGEN